MKRKTIVSLLFFTLVLFIFLPSNKTYAETKETHKCTSLQRPIVDNQGTLEEGSISTPKLAKVYSSNWNKYSTYYYYNQMNDNERSFYNSLNAVCTAYMEANYDATKIHLQNGEILDTISYQQVNGLNLDDAIRVTQIFFYSNPQYYFLKPYFPYGSINGINYISIGIYPDFAKGSNRAKATAAMKKKIESYVSQINSQKGIVAKEQKAHDLLVDSVTYGENTFDQSSYSAFITGQTVCAGYAGAFAMLCNAVDIDTAMVTSATHAFNYIRLNNSWYYVDCTWDDLDGQYNYSHVYSFFNRNRDKMRSLIPDQASDHVEESLWNNYMPTCTFDSGATAKSIGTIHTPSATTATPDIHISEENGYSRITLSSTTKDAVIYYTLNGTTPSPANTMSYRYNGPITVNNSGTIQAVAVSNGYKDSNLAKNNFQVVTRYALAPFIWEHPVSRNYSIGDWSWALSVGASSNDQGYLSYQWYQNGYLIPNATNAIYYPSTAAVGTNTYYCQVTNTNPQARDTKTASVNTYSATITVTNRNINSCGVKGLKDKTYNGKAQSQSLKLYWGNQKLKYGRDFELRLKNNKNIGRATVYIYGKGIYSGVRSYRFTISPKKAKITKLTGRRRSAKISWKKDTSVRGYQIQYSTSKNFHGKKTVTIKNAKTTSYTATRLQGRKKYYVRIRSYQKSSGKTYYGAYSNVKKVTVR